MANTKVRKAMVEADINQSRLAEILGWTESKVSNVLDVEMSAKTQSEIVEKIKEARRKADEAE